ncbi:pyroglutamyl-peptidase I [Haloferula sp. A504]|uniref:pyroglutamyl-peptidase I family protein n=1 Tax=Haloferula sp. A504 TaxID=3373601 RepID=UPI0031C38639|nr:hypothetical protein [Verrucomicrobiaceae bacterium E54]
MPSPAPLLITAFGPFGGRTVNASALALRGLRQTDRSFNYRILPVDQFEGPRRLRDAVRRLAPRALLLLGEAAGAGGIRLETRAWNKLDFSIPDIAGRQPRGRPIDATAPATISTPVDVRRLRQTLSRAGHPVELSKDPGRYLCNQIYFTALHQAAIPAIFVHLPLEERFPTARAVEAIRIIAAAL